MSKGEPESEDPRLRAAAARCLIDASSPSQVEALAMAAFMGIFHPGHPTTMAAFMGIFHPGHPTTDELVREARKGKRGSV